MTVKGIKIKPSKETTEKAKQEVSSFGSKYPHGIYIHLRRKYDKQDKNKGEFHEKRDRVQ